jgi:hypothetical protein
LFRTDGTLALFASLVTRAELIEAKRTGTKMCALVETALVADDFAGIESRSTPRGRLGGVTVETPAAKILGLLGCGVICVLNGETGMGRKV